MRFYNAALQIKTAATNLQQDRAMGIIREMTGSCGYPAYRIYRKCRERDISLVALNMLLHAEVAYLKHNNNVWENELPN